MEKRGALNFKVGQRVEMKSFLEGYRGAWFRCEIKDIQLKKNNILPEYYDFDPDELQWEKIYQVPPCSRKSKNVKKHLMFRPHYPEEYKQSEMPPLDSISQVCVVYDGNWKVGDLVDWLADGCFWSVRVVKVLGKDKFKVELPLPPLGEGKVGEEGIHEASGKDFRPTLNWSQTEGWTLPSVEGHTSCGAQLIFPTKQGMGLEPNPEPAAAASTTYISADGDGDSEQNEESVRMNNDLGMNLEPEPAAAGSTTRLSTEGDRESEQNEKSVKMDCDLGMDLEPDLDPEHAAAAAAAAGSTTLVSNEGDRDIEQNETSVKIDCDFMESSESTSRLQKKVVATDEMEKRELNIMHEDTLEAAVLDLEELVAKVKWLQRLLKPPSNDATPPSWKFA